MRHEILLGKLHADKFGGRDWWIRRGDLLAWNEQRQPVGAPRSKLESAEQERERSWQREYRERQKQEAKEKAASSKPANKSRQED